MGKMVGKIVDFIPSELQVHWKCSKEVISGPHLPEPNEIVKAEDVTLVQPHWDYAKFYLGRLVRYKTDKSARCFKVIGHRTRVTVQWENGDIAYHIPACDLESIISMSPVLLQPAAIVWKRSMDTADLKQLEDILHQYGVVQQVDVEKGLVDVRWWNATKDELDPVETCTFKDVTRHPGQEINLEDVVLLPQCEKSGISWFGNVVSCSVDGVYSVQLQGGDLVEARFHEIVLTPLVRTWRNHLSYDEDSEENSTSESQEMDQPDDWALALSNSKNERYGPLPSFEQVEGVESDVLHFTGSEVRMST
jgi:hypothetical protein